MSEFAIQTSNLGKQYRIGQKARYGLKSLPQAINSSQMTGRLLEFLKRRNLFWALRGVTFEVKRGEAVGIVGRNGSGKSTLLKILSRVTEPTEGKARIRGRSASFLEVGTGFHPELTGRENVYLNGSILGMKKREIDAKFDEIIEFSEVERFIDTPVKHYSSGMSVRLAFAVAAHLEPEILMVDEVLAVGDLKFQRKCLDRVKEVGRGGKTVLFVTHQMNAVRRLCSNCIWLENGTIKMFGPTAEVVTAYESASLARSADQAHLDGPTQFLNWQLEDAFDDPHWLEGTGPVVVKFTVRMDQPLRNGQNNLVLWNSNDEVMWGTAIQNINLDVGIYELFYSLPTIPLRPGSYRWQITLFDGYKVLDEWFAVPEMIIATEPVTPFSNQFAGFLNIPCDFRAHQMVKQDSTA